MPTKGGGALVLSPLPLGGRRRRGTKKMTKKVKAMLKKMKLMGGEDAAVPAVEGTGAEGEEVTGARRRRRGRGSRRTRRSRRHAGLFA
jgi:hypothetical protein